jgi:hypothetical protein
MGTILYSAQIGPSAEWTAYLERLKVKAADPAVRDLITTTYYRIWDESQPKTDDEQADIEPETIDELEPTLGEMTVHLVDLVIFQNLPEEDKETIPLDEDALAASLGTKPTVRLWQKVGQRAHRTTLFPELIADTKKAIAELEAAAPTD